MKIKNLFYILLGIILLNISCKKKDTNPQICKLITLSGTKLSPPYYYEYNINDKISKWKAYSYVTIYEYNSQNQLVKTYDRTSAALNQTLNNAIYYSNYNSNGYPLKALWKYENFNRRIAEIDFSYDNNNHITKTIRQLFDENDNVYKKDTANFYYDNDGNFLKGSINIKANGLWTEVITIKAENYDSKPSYNKSLGLEYQLQSMANTRFSLPELQFFYLTTNNPGKIYIYGIDNKADNFIYQYEYDSMTGYPTEISTTSTISGITNDPVSLQTKYNCK